MFWVFVLRGVRTCTASTDFSHSVDTYNIEYVRVSVLKRSRGWTVCRSEDVMLLFSQKLDLKSRGGTPSKNIISFSIVRFLGELSVDYYIVFFRVLPTYFRGLTWVVKSERCSEYAESENTNTKYEIGAVEVPRTSIVSDGNNTNFI